LSRMVWILAGILFRSARTSLIWPEKMFPRSCARYRPSRYAAVIWARNALVDATAISGPACVYSTASDSRGMVEPLVLQMEMVLAPCSRAYRTAIRVSMVSPDWLMDTTRVFSSRIGSR